jgi:hypothetical protein
VKFVRRCTQNLIYVALNVGQPYVHFTAGDFWRRVQRVAGAHTEESNRIITEAQLPSNPGPCFDNALAVGGTRPQLRAATCIPRTVVA